MKQINIHVSAFSIYVGSGPDLNQRRVSPICTPMLITYDVKSGLWAYPRLPEG